ncbi:MAG: (2Fe-2S)-binding protein [Rhodobacteraceae bacterium]|nr:(2Fe-2S)-binding protein [Paracoccaceae bacterium]
MSRLPHGGLIDRSRSVSFMFDGKSYGAHPGDTVASALLANGAQLMGRSFKYHRPRGVLTAGSEEPNALIEVGSGASRLPNTRATVQEVFAGLETQSQNRWPTLGFDIKEALDLAHPFLGAGFYYKTFMWPRAAWLHFWEPIIRRAAGLGRLSGEADPAVYDKAWKHCDLLVVGAGPAGLMAALTAGRAGKRVVLADEDFVLGGRLQSEALEVGGESSRAWVSKVVGELVNLPNVTVMKRTTITGAYDGGTYGALERVADHLPDAQGAPQQIFWRIVAKHTILAGGAHERPIAFPNNDRPGIMLASAVRSYIHRYGVLPARRWVVFANNNEGLRTAHDLLKAGAEVTLVDTRKDAHPEISCRHLTGAEVVNTRGRLGLKAVQVRLASGTTEWIEADGLAMAGGWNPSVHLTCHMGARPAWQEDIAAFVPRAGAVPGLVAVGAASGAFTTQAALRAGAEAAAKAMGVKPADTPKAEDAPYEIKPFWHVLAKGRAWLDFQNDVTVKDVVQAHAENMQSVEHMKRYTTLGMATDQGKTANIGALAVMAGLTGQSIPETGTTMFRPPYTPVQMGALGGPHVGAGFAPEQLMPADKFARDRGANWVEMGLWQRPSLFKQGDERTWRQSCDREVLMVRGAVGVTEVSTLGKIEVQGPDAADFLDRIFLTPMKKLKPGRIRYGLMLRRDGFVMDDGTVARLAEDHFVLHPTTGASAEVLSHLEFCAHVRWPTLDVQIIDVTENWAQMAVHGPMARKVLDGPAFMHFQAMEIEGVQARVFGVSYCGEAGFEIAVPARYGNALMAWLLAKAKALGGGLYGLEALNVMRVEKGYLTHAEIDGRVSHHDLGFPTPEKYFIGKDMAAREGLRGPELVGLKTVGTVKALVGGALLVEGEFSADNVVGHVTSAVFSPTLGHMVALGLLENGRARHGETVQMVDAVSGITATCEIGPPVFLDAKGERLRA